MNAMTPHLYVLDSVPYVIPKCGWVILTVGWLPPDNLFIKIRMVVIGKGEVAHSVKLLPRKHGAMNSDLWSPQKELDKVVCTCNFSNREIGVVSWQILGAHWPAT